MEQVVQAVLLYAQQGEAGEDQNGTVPRPIRERRGNLGSDRGISLAFLSLRMTMRFPKTDWAIILGGSSGFGLATAHKLSAHGMSLCIVHRDRRGAMARIDAEFE